MFNTYQEIFDNRAWSYHQAMRSVPDARRREFEIALDYLQPEKGQMIADMPAGGGYLKQYLDDPSISLLFIETTHAFARHCPQVDGCRSLIGDFHGLPLQPGSVSSLLSLAALHHVEDKARFFRQCHHVLPAQGRLVIADVQAATAQAGFLNEFVDEFNSMGHKGDFLTPGVVEELHGSGFEVSRQQLHVFPWTFGSWEEMIHYCRLLFGVDRADDRTMQRGIEEYLSPRRHGDDMTLEWSLYYLCATPRSQSQGIL